MGNWRRERDCSPSFPICGKVQGKPVVCPFGACAEPLGRLPLRGPPSAVQNCSRQFCRTQQDWVIEGSNAISCKCNRKGGLEGPLFYWNWRRTQSGPNLSLAKYPVTRENTGNIHAPSGA